MPTTITDITFSAGTTGTVTAGGVLVSDSMTLAADTVETDKHAPVYGTLKTDDEDPAAKSFLGHNKGSAMQLVCDGRALASVYAGTTKDIDIEAKLVEQS